MVSRSLAPFIRLAPTLNFCVLLSYFALCSVKEKAAAAEKFVRKIFYLVS
jgi:hypothetical protein